MLPDIFFKTLGKQKLHRAVMATVISKAGHGPVTTGARMLVVNNQLIGTIGGGEHEKQVLNTLAELKSPWQLLKLGKRSHQQDTCGGSKEVIIEVIDLTNPHVSSFWQTFAAQVLARTGTISLVSAYCEDKAPIHHIYSGNTLIAGPRDSVPERMPNQQKIPSLYKTSSNNQITFSQSFIPEGRIIILGAGHVAVECCLLAERNNFPVVVVDPRSDLCDAQRFSPDCTIFNQAYGYYLENNPPRLEDYILIMGPNHQTDTLSLAAAVATEVGFIGFLGGKGKIASAKKHLENENLHNKVGNRLSAPVGIPINSHTPPEVAVSIIAELIKTRGLKRKSAAS